MVFKRFIINGKRGTLTSRTFSIFLVNERSTGVYNIKVIMPAQTREIKKFLNAFLVMANPAIPAMYPAADRHVQKIWEKTTAAIKA